MRIKNIDDVASYQLCCGCGACAYADPETYEMIDTLKFGRRPRRKRAAGESSDAFAVCPGHLLRHGSETASPGLDRDLLPLWGPVLGLWEGYAADEELRFKGSSGGAASSLALFGLEKAGIRGVLHVAPRIGTPYLNGTVLSTSREGLLAGAGSRYAPASPCDGLAMIEKADGPCIAVGKPCDIAAVNNASAIRSALKEKIALTISVFCAGTPTNQGVLAMIRAFGVPDPRALVSLRYRGHGWPGDAEATFMNGPTLETRQMTYDRCWGSILQKHRQWRCYICPDHTGEFADISVGDPWYRSDRGSNPGQSLVLARTERGRAFLAAAAASGYIRIGETSADALSASQPGLIKTRGSLWARLIALRMLGVPAPRYIRFHLFSQFVRRLSFAEKASSFFRTVRRVYVKKLGQRQVIEPLSLSSGPDG
jgi:coenzyme F420 hydrogenase subunit beta